MIKNAFLFLLLVSISFIGINCGEESNSPLLFNSDLTASSSESSGNLIDVETGNSGFVYKPGFQDFSYSDTLFLKDYRIDAVPGPGEDPPEGIIKGQGTYYGTSVILPNANGEMVIYYYYFPPMCGDFVLIHEDGQVGRYRTNESCY